jgi:hypothetical protein
VQYRLLPSPGDQLSEYARKELSDSDEKKDPEMRFLLSSGSSK